jgi:hypothetical protein
MLKVSGLEVALHETRSNDEAVFIIGVVLLQEAFQLDSQRATQTTVSQ